MSKYHKETNEIIKEELISFLHLNGFTKSYLTDKEVILVKGDYASVPKNISITIEQLQDTLKTTDCNVSDFNSFLEDRKTYEASKLLSEIEAILKD